jgi:hypothetical protein
MQGDSDGRLEVYVVVTDPDFYTHYDSVWLSEESARSYIQDEERRNKHLYGPEFLKRGRWMEKHHTDLERAILVWGYPGYGNTHGIIREEFTG